MPQLSAARSCTPGFSAVVWTENGGPLPSDQVSRRHVTATATRAPPGHSKPPLAACVMSYPSVRPIPRRLSLRLSRSLHEPTHAALSIAFICAQTTEGKIDTASARTHNRLTLHALR